MLNTNLVYTYLSSLKQNSNHDLCLKIVYAINVVGPPV